MYQESSMQAREEMGHSPYTLLLSLIFAALLLVDLLLSLVVFLLIIIHS